MFDEHRCAIETMLIGLHTPSGATHGVVSAQYEQDQEADATVVAEQTCGPDPDVEDQWSVEPTALSAGVELEVAAAGGEIIDACANKSPAAPKEGSPGIVHLDPPKNLAEAGYADHRARTKTSGSLWTTILLWMSGECGLYLYIVLCILAKSSSLWFHAHNWAIGADSKPRLLQSDGSFLCLPAGMRACELPDTSLKFLREIIIAQAQWQETFAPQLELADEHLSPRLQAELRKRIPDSYCKASKQYVKHAVSYQLLPFSLARLSEPSAPAFTRALICVFFPALALAHGLHAPTIDQELDDAASQADHWAAADESLPEATAEAVCQMLSTALSDADEARQQRCHERLFQIAIENQGISVASKYLNKVRQRNKSEHEEMVQKAEEAGSVPERKAAKQISSKDKEEAQRLRSESMQSKRCFSLGLLERCSFNGKEPNVLLSQLLRVSLSNHGNQPAGHIRWGEECCCDTTHKCHESTCWWSVYLVYFFLEQEFFHLFIHQMWVEGAFNRLSHNHDNSSPELMEAKLEARMNDTCEVMVPSAEINARLRELEQAKKAASQDTAKRTQDIKTHFMQKPTKQRVVGRGKDQQGLTADEKQKKASEKKSAAAAKKQKTELAKQKKEGEEQDRKQGEDNETSGRDDSLEEDSHSDCSEASGSDDEEQDAAIIDRYSVSSIVGKRQVDDKGKPESAGGCCRLVRWFDTCSAVVCPPNQCTWEPFTRAEHALEHCELVTEPQQVISMRMGGKLHDVHVVSCLGSSTTYKLKFGSSRRKHPADGDYDLETPPSSNCTEWCMKGMVAEGR